MVAIFMGIYLFVATFTGAFIDSRYDCEPITIKAQQQDCVITEGFAMTAGSIAWPIYWTMWSGNHLAKYVVED